MGSISNHPNHGSNLFRGCPLCGVLIQIEMMNQLYLDQNKLLCPRCHGLPVAQFVRVEVRYKVEDQP